MKPSIPKGTRDFSPTEMVKRNYIFDAIKNVYRRYGFEQIDTPAMENLSMLEGKYGEEGDKLLFRILNSGNVVEDIRHKAGEIKNSDITEKGLRYDLTVPFARYVVMHQNDITFPFKRYQIQPVWRADRPQKGRYREFYQCDADIIGSTSLMNEVELLSIIRNVFDAFKLGVKIKVNNRKILSGIASIIGAADKIIDITVAIDKLDKIGMDKVKEELISKGLTPDAVQKLEPIIMLQGTNAKKLDTLKVVLKDSEEGKLGIQEIEFVLSRFVDVYNAAEMVELDITLARGLNYYTGSIIEVKVDDKRSTFTGSICGGGRYDDLTGIFGLPNMSGVGISFGADRIYDVLEECKNFPDFSGVSTKILFVNFGEAEAIHCLKIATHLRNDGINAEVFPDTAKVKRQMSYADAKKIPFVALIGSDEMHAGIITVKNMQTGEQSSITMDELVHILK